MANLIQIKRSLNTANATGLANGEMAYTANGDVLFIGSNGAVVPVGGARNPGTLTANQALIANSTSGIDKVIVANAVLTRIYANGAHGNSQSLLANSTGGLFWGTTASSLDDLSDVAVSAASTGQVLIANSTGFFRNVSLSGDITINADGVTAIAADSIALGTDTTGNYVATIAAGNGISGSSSTEGGAATIAVVANSGIVSNSTGVFANVDGSTLELSGGAIQVKNDGIALGTKTTGNYVATITAGNGLSGNATSEGSAPTIAVVAGSGVASNATGVHVVAGDGITSNSTGVFVTDGEGLSVNSTGVHVGAGNGLSVNATSVAVVANSGLASNSTGVFVVANSGIVSNSTGVFANVDGSTLELSGGAIQVKNDGIALGTKTTGNYVATIAAGNGISGSSSSEGGAATIAVVANSGLASNSTGVFVVAGTGVVSNATGVHIGQAVGTTDNVTFNDVTINGNTVLGSNASDVVSIKGLVNTSIIPAANITYSLGNTTSRFLTVFAQNVHSEYLYIDKDVTIGGNLVISGNLVSVNVSTLSVTDSLIQLASNNTVSDSLDIGFFGNYQTGGGDPEHTGLFRDASDDKFKLFKGLQVAPTTTVDTANNTYQIATLQAYLDSGGLTTNSTAVALTANSTLAVTLTANSLTLTTALVGTSGGTGLASYTAEDILVANSSNGFRKLGLGTDGFVLQSNGTALVYSTLDGGTF